MKASPMATAARVAKSTPTWPRRLRLEWISSAEGGKFAEVMRDMTEDVRELGPLDLDGTEEVSE